MNQPERPPPPQAKRHLGQILIDQGILTEDQLRIALLEQTKQHVPVGKLLVQLGFVSEATLRDALSENGLHRAVGIATLNALCDKSPDRPRHNRKYGFNEKQMSESSECADNPEGHHASDGATLQRSIYRSDRQQRETHQHGVPAGLRCVVDHHE